MADDVLPHAATHPLILLPIRIETRYLDSLLRVRIFPDQIHLDSHEPELTAEEVGAGQRYWEALWRCSGEHGPELIAWTNLCTGRSPERAAWVARLTEPTNPQDRPTTPVDAFVTPPQFPGVTTHEAAWTRAARARALPQRWHVVATSADRSERIEAVSTAVRPDLVVGPSPAFDPSTVPAGAPPVDPDTAWLVDFAEAEAAGMAVTMPLVGSSFLGGIDRLLVYGVREETDPTVSGQLLADLFEAHQATDGFGYVAPGTPTNQTTGDAATGRRSKPWREGLRVTPSQKAPASPSSNAAVLATALGLNAGGSTRPGPTGSPSSERATALGRGLGADREDEVAARAATDVLWPATWGGFLWQQCHPMFSISSIEVGRAHARAYLRAGGPLPTVRVGDQPYGILPITPLKAWQDLESGVHQLPKGLLPAAVVAFIRRLRQEVWEPAVPNLPHIAGDGTDPQETVLRILGMAPTAQRFAGRSMLGMEYLANLWRFADLNLDEAWQLRLREEAEAWLARFGLTGDPRVGRAVFANTPFDVDMPVVRAEGGPAPSDYLVTLVGMGPTALRGASRLTPGPTPLLYLLARHALLTEYAMAADLVLNRRKKIPTNEHLDPELVGILPGRTDVTVWERFARQVPTSTDAVTVEDYLQMNDPHDRSLAGLRILQDALKTLAELPEETLEQLVRETLPLASHRLDAWITSLSTRRLRWMRGQTEAAASGLHIGAYGWVEGLRRADSGVESIPRPAGEEATPVFRQPGNAGFVHAPSLAQATTAAVLRAGQQAHRDENTAGDGGPLAVNLPSRRVRLANWLLEGVRQGQTLGTLLGYRFERGLQEHPVGTLAAWIDEFRRIAPVRGTRISHGQEPTDTVVATDATDGLALQRLWRAGQVDLDAMGLGQATRPDEHLAALQLLADLDDAVDAVADSLLVESIHQIVQGRPQAAGATLDATASGESPPPELESMRTPRAGIAVTHRVLVALPEPDTAAASWTVDPDTQVRAVAEPRLEAWLRSLLPAPERVWLRVRVDAPEGGSVTRAIDLGGLRLSALDYVLMSPGDGSSSELEQHLAALVSARADVPAGATLTFDYVRDARWEPQVLTVGEFLEAVRAARELLASARPLTPRDLATPETPPSAPIADDEVTARADVVVEALYEAAAALADSARLREGVRRANALGVPLTAPPPLPPQLDQEPSAQAALARVAATAAVEVARRQAKVGALSAELAEPARSIAVLQAVLGETFPVVAAFPAPDLSVLRPTAASSQALQYGDRFAALTWATRMARVRPGVGRLVAVLTQAEALGMPEGLGFEVAQRPNDYGERWIGLPKGVASPSGSRVGFVVHVAGAGGGRAAGLVVDEWTEVIPADKTTTGVAYHFDTPGAQAPQAMLLAVPPDARANWSTGLVEDTLHEALDLAKLRLVDLESLRPADSEALTDIGQFLPAACFAFNLAGDVISTDFRGES